MKRPWNRVDTQVYSLATTDTNGHANMNICSYVTPISMDPKLYCIALYDDTKTLANVLETKKGLLQILSQQQTGFVKKLGMISAMKKPDKLKNIPYLGYKEFRYIPNVLAIIELEFTQIIDVDGDHKVAVGKVLSYKHISESKPLTLDVLREKKIIRG